MKASKKDILTRFRLLFVFVASAFFASSLASAAVDSKIQKAAQIAGASAVTEFSFQTGSAQLPYVAKTNLEKFIQDARKKGEIKEIQVLAWADKEYPQKGTTLAKSDVNMAEKRADNIESYIKSKFDITDIRKMNMGERPNIVQESVQTPTAQTKNSMEQTGAAPSHEDHLGIFGTNGKASQAVILVFYK